MNCFERVFLSDNKMYLLDNNCIVETICEAQHGDWKTDCAHNVLPIPKGTQLEVCEVWKNFYGVWVQVFYNGRYYDLCPRDLKYVTRII